MDRGGVGVMGSCGVLVVCSLLLKTLRSLLMGRVCSLLIAGLQLLSGDLEAKEAEHAAVKKNVFVRLPRHGPHKGWERGRACRWPTVAGRFCHLCTVA